MNHTYYLCPRCKRGDALGAVWHHLTGRECRTCHGLNRPEHPGRKVHFDVHTGEEIHPVNGLQARLLNLNAAGVPMSFRGYPARYLHEVWGITGIPAKTLDQLTHSSLPHIGVWALGLAAEGYALSVTPINRDGEQVGAQLRPFPLDNRPESIKDFRTIGSTEGLLVPAYAGLNPSAVVITEGPWDAVAIGADAADYGNHDLVAVAAMNAGVKASTIRSTLDLIFPGVPRFSLFDQDPAGVAARLATLDVATPILITGAGSGKDYRELIPELRFERLVEIVVRELRALGY